MAKAKLIEQVEEKPFCTLELTLAEARALRCILAKIGGDWRDTWRRHTDGIAEAMTDIGVNHRMEDTSRFTGMLHAEEVK